MRVQGKTLWLLPIALLSSFAFVGCSSGSGGAGGTGGTNNGVFAGTYRNVSVIGTNNQNNACPGSAANANTTYSCGDGETLTVNTDGTYQMTGIDAGIIGSGTYTMTGNAITFQPNGGGTGVTAEVTVNGNQANLRWTSDIFTGITLVYQKQ